MTDVKLNKEDKKNLLKFLEHYAEKVSDKHIAEIDRKLKHKISVVRHNKKLPSFVDKMIRQIQDLDRVFNSDILTDEKRKRVIGALHYFVWAEDRIPDYIPIVGYLDDAFIISIVHNEVKKELETISR